MIKRIIMLGPPGSGKGTWAKILSDSLSLPHISSGDLFREELAEDSPLGREIRSYVEGGTLVPDDVTIRLIEQAITEGPGREGFILDGFPRTLVQAQALEAILEEEGTGIDTVIELDIPEEILIERALARMVCVECGQPYHAEVLRPKTEGVCDRCGGKVVRRSDDTAETLKQRFKTYHELTEPLIDYYKDQGKLVAYSRTQPPGAESKKEMARLLGLPPGSVV